MSNSTPATSNLSKRVIAGLLFGFLIILGLMIFGDLRQVGQVLQNFQWSYFALTLVCTLFNYTLRFYKWHFYIQQMGVKDFSWRASARLFVAGFPLAVTPGKVGEGLKGVWLNQATGLPVGRGISIVVAERISDGLAVLLLSTLGVVAYPQYTAAFVVILVGLLGAMILSQIRPAAHWLLDLMAKIPLINRFAHGLREFYEGSFALYRLRPTLTAVLLGMVSWLGEGLGFYWILIGLGFVPSWQLLAEAIFVLSFSTVVGAASTLPGGLGAAEASIAGMLTLILQAPPAQVTSATLLIRLATLWFGVALGLLVWLFSADLLGLRSGHANSHQR